jgi:hypothetical protein
VSHNHTLRVEITFVRVKITHCVWKLHSACRNHTLRVEITLYVNKSHSCVLKTFRSEITPCVCSYHSMRVHITHKSDFYTHLSVIITFVSVIITFVSVIITFVSVIITFVSVIITLIRVNIAFCVYKSHYACEHHTLRVNITLYV